MKAFFTVLQPQIAADYIFYATILQNIISYVSGRKPTSFLFFSGSVKEDFRKTFDLLYHCVRAHNTWEESRQLPWSRFAVDKL